MTELKGKNKSKNEYPLLFAEDKENSKQKQVRFKKAWQEAKKAADMLKIKFDAKKVYVFGSLVDKSRFNMNSDIDLAEQGIPDEKFYAAVGAVTRLITNFKVDLVDIDFCRKSLKKSIKREGIEI